MERTAFTAFKGRNQFTGRAVLSGAPVLNLLGLSLGLLRLRSL